MRSAKSIADEIARDLFTAGDGRRAERLVMEWDGKQDGTKWAERPVAALVRRVLLAARRHPRRRARS